jgi:neutral ceramidase
MLNVGFGQADITPQPGCSQTGSYRRRVMTGVHDPLLAVACVIDDGTAPAALVGIDAGVILRETADAAKQLIAERTAIPVDQVIISASHTHQGGPTLSTLYAEADPAYARVVAEGIAKAVADAWTARRDGAIAAGFGRVGGIHFNRRFLMRDGREVTHPGKMHLGIVRPAGPVDEKVGVLAFREAASGAIAGVVVNFGCHCTVTEDGAEYSADYVYYLRERLRQAFPGAAVVFLTGACGDVTQIDNQKPTMEKGHAWAQSMGETLATEVQRVTTGLTFSSDAGLCFVTTVAAVGIRDRDACDPPTLGLGSGDEWERIYAREAALMAQRRAQTPRVDCRVTAVRIGDLAIVCNGAELFVQPALDIQSASPIAKTWVVTLANEYVGYVPTASAHCAGGYEVRLARSSFLAVDAAQQLIEASLRALNALP